MRLVYWKPLECKCLVSSTRLVKPMRDLPSNCKHSVLTRLVLSLVQIWASPFPRCCNSQLTPPSGVILGAHEGLGDSVCRRRCLLPRLQCHGVRRQRGERASLDAAAGADDSPEHSGDEKPPRDSQRPGKHIILNAGKCAKQICG